MPSGMDQEMSKSKLRDGKGLLRNVVYPLPIQDGKLFSRTFLIYLNDKQRSLAYQLRWLYVLVPLHLPAF